MPDRAPRLACTAADPQNLRLYRELAGVLMAAGDRAGLIAACQRWGDAHTGAVRKAAVGG